MCESGFPDNPHIKFKRIDRRVTLLTKHILVNLILNKRIASLKQMLFCFDPDLDGSVPCYCYIRLPSSSLLWLKDAFGTHNAIEFMAYRTAEEA